MASQTGQRRGPRIERERGPSLNHRDKAARNVSAAVLASNCLRSPWYNGYPRQRPA